MAEHEWQECDRAISLLVIDAILCVIFGRTFLWGCVVPDWRDEVCTAVERWIEVVGGGIGAACGVGGRS